MAPTGDANNLPHTRSPASNRYAVFTRIRFVDLLAWVVVVMAFATFDASAQSLVRKRVTVTILHFSNVFQPVPVDNGSRGGMARVATIVKQVRDQSPNTLLLLGGNTISPSAESITFKGHQMIRAWNGVGLHYAVVGDHEFDFGPELLRTRISESSFKWLATNVIDKTTNSPFANTPTHVIREFEGVKVGLFGIAWPETKFRSMPGPNLDFENPCETATKMVRKLKAEGAHFIIALSHLPIAENQALVRCAPEINLVLGGVEYDRRESFVHGRPVFTVTTNAREIGRFDISFSPNLAFESIQWSSLPVDADVREDPAVAEIIKPFTFPNLSDVVGRTTVPLDATSRGNRTRETNLGSYIADRFLKAAQTDVAFFNGGAISANTVYSPGNLTRREILAIFPFQNRILRARVSGEILRQILETSVSRSLEDEEPGRFLQVAGLKFVFNASRPVGSRVLAVTIGGKPLDEKANYTIATTGFLFDGGDGYSILKGASLEGALEEGLTDTEILRRAIAADGVISPKVEGRIVRLDQSGVVEKR